MDSSLHSVRTVWAKLSVSRHFLNGVYCMRLFSHLLFWGFHSICDSHHSTKPAEIHTTKMQIEYLLSTLLFMSEVSVFQHHPKHKAKHWRHQRCHSAACLTQNGQFTLRFVISNEHRQQRFWLKWTGRDLFCCGERCDTVNWAESDITASSFNLFFMASPFRMHHRDKISSHISPSCHTQVSGSVMRPHPRNRLMWVRGICVWGFPRQWKSPDSKSLSSTSFT